MKLRRKNNEWHHKCSSPPRQIANLLLWAYFYPSLSVLFSKTCRKRWKRVAKVTSPRHGGGSYDLSYFFVVPFTLLPWQQGTDWDECEKVAVVNLGPLGSALIGVSVWVRKRLNHQFTSCVICLCDSHSVFTGISLSLCSTGCTRTWSKRRLRNAI